MGKANKAQRTKGNTRPSSSGHSAELLNSCGTPLSGIIGFSALCSDVPNQVTTSGFGDVDNIVDSTFCMLTKKMLKKDPTTRVKALQEFKEHCSEEERSSLKNVLPFWPRLFNKLALDIDRRVREATHETNSELIAKVKRDFAPYLKNIMGVWLLGMCDPHTSAAAEAHRTFLKTFPPPKQAEALVFCKTEVFQYFANNLFEQTPKSLSDQNTTAEEDIESKYVMVITATLHAIKLFIIIMNKAEGSNIEQDIRSIISNNKFWKYSKNKNTPIRSAWYELVSSLCSDMPTVFVDTEQNLYHTVFGALLESDPVVATFVWRAGLYTGLNFENCFSGSDIQKLVVDELWIMLKEGGGGNARVSFPCMLPFLSKMPRAITEKEAFLTKWFALLREGLMVERIKSSSVECEAIIMAFMECLQYVVCNLLNYNEKGSELLDKIIMGQLLPLVESSFSDENAHLALSKLYPLLGLCLMRFEQQCAVKNKDVASAFTNVLNVFWKKLTLIICKLFDEKLNCKNKRFSFLSNFFHSIYLPQDGEKSKGSDILIKDLNVRRLNKSSCLFHYALTFCKVLYERLSKSFDIPYVALLDEIISLVKSAEFFKELADQLKLSRSYEPRSPVALFEGLLNKWMSLDDDDDKQPSMTYFVNIVYAICSCTASGIAVLMLDRCCQVQEEDFLDAVFYKGVNSYKDEPFFLKWLRSATLWNTVVFHVDETALLILDHDAKDIDYELPVLEELIVIRLLKYGFKGSYIHKVHLECVLNVLKGVLGKSVQEGKCILNLVNFVCVGILTIVENSQDYWKIPTLDELLTLLFHLSIESKLFKLEGAKENMKKTFHTSVKAMVSFRNEPLKEGEFLSNAIKELHGMIQNIEVQDQVTQVIEHGSILMSAVEAEEHSSVSSCLLQKLMLTKEEWTVKKKELSINILPYLLERKIFYPLPEDPRVYPEDCICIPSYVLVAEIISDILINKINASHGKEDIFLQQCIVKEMPHLLMSYTFYESHGCLKKEGTTKCDKAKKLQRHCFVMLSILNPEDINKFVKDIFAKSISEGGEWTFLLQTLIEIVKKLIPEKLTSLTMLINMANEAEGFHKYVTTQLLIRHISKENKKTLLESLSVKLLDQLEHPTFEERKDDILGLLAEMISCMQEVDVVKESKSPGVKNVIYALMKHEIVLNNLRAMSLPKNDHELLLIVQLEAFLASTLKSTAQLFDKETWIFLRVVLLASLRVSRSSIVTPKIIPYKYNMCLLLRATSLLYEDQEQYDYIPNWEDLALDDIHRHFVTFYIQLAMFFGAQKNLYGELISLLECASVAAEYASPKSVLDSLINEAKKREPGLKIQKDPVLDVNAALAILFPFLWSDNRYLQYAAHNMYLKVLPMLQVYLIKQIEGCDEGSLPLMLYDINEMKKYGDHVTNNVLNGVKIEVGHTIEPYTDDYTKVVGYLFMWQEIMNFHDYSPEKLFMDYFGILIDNGLTSPFLSNIFRLLPEDPVNCLREKYGSLDDIKELFDKDPCFDMSDAPSERDIQILACFLFVEVLRYLPVVARTWWNNLDKRSAEAVSRYTSKYVTNMLCDEEIADVQFRDLSALNSMSIKTRAGNKEIIATYQVDNYSVELWLRMPPNYPLVPVIVEQRGNMRVPECEYRQWLMKLMTVMTFQNGSLLEGLVSWKKNLDKKFEGVEECMICYYILHSTTNKLPKLTCNVCKKKFHSDCLYEWFRTSNNSSCPMCRNEFIS